MEDLSLLEILSHILNEKVTLISSLDIGIVLGKGFFEGGTNSFS